MRQISQCPKRYRRLKGAGAGTFKTEAGTMSSPETADDSGSAKSGQFDQHSAAVLATKTILSAPGVKASEALADLLPFLLTPEPVVEELPALFLPAGTGTDHVDPGAMLEVAVAGKIVYAHVRWLDDLADSLDRPLAP